MLPSCHLENLLLGAIHPAVGGIHPGPCASTLRPPCGRGLLAFGAEARGCVWFVCSVGCWHSVEPRIPGATCFWTGRLGIEGDNAVVGLCCPGFSNRRPCLEESAEGLGTAAAPEGGFASSGKCISRANKTMKSRIKTVTTLFIYILLGRWGI